MIPIRIVIIAKAPIAGFAKTRLVPALGAHGAARLANRMLLHTLEQSTRADVTAVELCVTPSIEHEFWKTLDIPDTVTLTDQGSGDLGARLARATQRAVDRGEAILLIGTDCPELSMRQLNAAARALDHCDAVIHPTVDGGYALLGLRQFDASLFTGMEWSTASVACTTINRIQHLDWSLHVAATLHDIDEPADLVHLGREWTRGLRHPAMPE
ncbi:MAG: TIGR04282 family arsenosugar biosynthesis glycosyltransferase [Steroidobacteraceae bacterium]